MSVSTRAQSRKRQRTDTEEPSNPTAKPCSTGKPNIQVQRHDDLWFEDGNIVLVAEDDVAFRVHRGVLSRHSEVFRDMFLLPVPPKGSDNAPETFDGCPMVHLQDLSTDLIPFLSVLYDVGTSTLFNQKTSTFALISASLRLGSKYQVEHVLQKALSRLEECFPTSFSDWDRFFHRRDEWVPIELTDDDAICVVNLARSLDLSSVLPSALYACTQLSSHSLVHGIKSSDGTFQRLSPADLEACLDGRDLLLDKNIQVTACLVDLNTSPNCRRKKDCASAMRKLTQMAHRMRCLAGYDTLTPLMPAWLPRANESLTLPMCDECLTHLATLEKGNQEVVWDELEEIFGLSQSSAVVESA